MKNTKTHYEARIIAINWREEEVDYTSEMGWNVDYYETLEDAKEEAKRLLKYTFNDKSEWDSKFVRIEKVIELVDEDDDYLDTLSYETIEDIRYYKWW